LKRKFVLILKSFYYQWVLRIEKTMYRPVVPCPGKKAFPAFRGTKKGGGSSLPNAGFRRFSPVIPLPPRLFAETRKGEFRKFLPTLFGFGACFFPRATKKRA
jgi:hypothetical protein